MKERDVKDTPFLALALQLGCPLWSNDKHFQGLEGVLVYSTEAFVELPKGKGSWR
jgi:predicted nucleic acid-binding protein